MAKDKLKKLEGLVRKASEYSDNIEYKSTGILPLDIALKTGGYVSGRICEYFGPNHSGKTLTSMLGIIWDQKIFNRPSLFVDTEGSFDIKWFIKLGGIPELLDIYDPYNQTDVHGEEVYDNVIELIGGGKYSFCVLDSMMGSALLSKELLEKGLDDTQRMGVQAKLHKGFLMRSFIKTKQTNTNLIVTNHVADNIGVMFGDKETTPGGNDMKFRAEQRLRIGTPKEKTPEGHKVTGVIKKNKRGASAGHPFDFYLSYTYGIDNYAELAKLLVREELLEKKKKEELIVAMKENYLIYDEHKNKLLNYINDGRPPQENKSEEEIDNEFEKD